jgi:hypothetical protein
MNDLASLPTSTNGAATPLFWQRITNKQVAIGTVLVALVLLGLGLIVALRYVLLMLFLGIVVATALTPMDADVDAAEEELEALLLDLDSLLAAAQEQRV